jgi:hypothetical protein
MTTSNAAMQTRHHRRGAQAAHVVIQQVVVGHEHHMGRFDQVTCQEEGAQLGVAV